MAKKKANPHAGHRSRLRKQFLNSGIEHFYPHQILELLLFYVIPQRDTNPLAHALLDRFKTIDKVFAAEPEELAEVPGIGLNTAVFLKAVSGIYSEYGHPDAGVKTMIDNPFTADAYYSTVFRRSDGEQYGITVLDDDSSVFYTEKIEVSDSSDGRPAARRIIEALAKSNCRRCVIAHFLPAGAGVNGAERNSVGEIINAAGRMNISLEQYYLITDSSITSFMSEE